MTQITVMLDSCYAVDLLMKRLEFWEPDDIDRKLYKQMYENYIDCGAFDNVELDPKIIVDNDWINYCSTIYKGDEDFQQLLEAWEADERDVSCDSFPSGSKYGYIEAYANDAFLVRYG